MNKEISIVNIIKLQNIAMAAIEHCIAVDYDFIVANYDDWDQYLMETIGYSYSDLANVGIVLEDLWR